MRSLVHCALLTSIAIAAVSPSAVAEPPHRVDKAKAKAAKQYVDAGLAAQATGDYDTAITFYEKAYALVPHPVLWFNMAQVHRLAGRDEDALALYAKYLAADPNGPQAQLARTWVADIEQRKAEQARKAEEARAAEEARKAEATRKAEEDRAEEARQAEAKREAARKAIEAKSRAGAARSASTDGNGGVQTAVSATRESVSGDATASLHRTMRIAGIMAGGTGLLVFALGVGYGLREHSISDQLSQPGAPFYQSEYDRGQRDSLIANVAMVTGGALILSGAALTWFGLQQRTSADRIGMAPLVAPGVTGLLLRGTLP